MSSDIKKAILSLLILLVTFFSANAQDSKCSVKLSVSSHDPSSLVIYALVTNTSKTLSIKSVEIKLSYGDPQQSDSDNMWQITKKKDVEIAPGETIGFTTAFEPKVNDAEAFSAYVNRVIFSDGSVRKGYGNIYFKETQSTKSPLIPLP